MVAVAVDSLGVGDWRGGFGVRELDVQELCE
jgi:hypothetical protein